MWYGVDNPHGPYTVSVIKRRQKWDTSLVTYPVFLRSHGTITCTVTGNRRYSSDLPQEIPLYLGWRKQFHIGLAKIQAACKALNSVVPPRKIDALRLDLVEFFFANSYTKYTVLPYFMPYSLVKNFHVVIYLAHIIINFGGA